jgi:ATP-binding cassette subfamily F protein uup
MPPLLVLQDIGLRFAQTPLLEGASLQVEEGERICLVGRNGSGKSTLLKIAGGLLEPDRGTRFVQPGRTVRYLPQEPDLSRFASIRAFVEAGLAPADDRNRAHALIGQLGLDGERGTAHLSGGEARRAALAQVLAPSPDILLLDEPTNHLDLPAIEWLENELAGFRGALVLISHDRRFLERLSRVTVWLDRGTTRRLDAGFAQFEAWRDQVLEEEETAQHKLARKIAREDDWVRYGVSGRRKRNQRRLAELGALRAQKRAFRAAPGAVKMTLSESGHASALLIKADNLSKSFGETQVLRDFSLRLLRGDRLAVIGPNGSGKTTLLNILTGALPPDGGTLKRAPELRIATLDQSRASLAPNITLGDALTGGSGETVGVGGEKRHVTSYMKDFLFAPEQRYTPLRLLSGGERARLLLAIALAKPADLLVLDEPTNDLDLETLDLLQEMIGDYPGTVLLVSHDRDFLDRVATSVLLAEGDGRFTEYPGGYSDMLRLRGGAGIRGTATPAAANAPAPRRGAKPRKAKLSFKDRHALNTLPAAIADLEKRTVSLQTELGTPELYKKEPARFAALVAQLEAAQRELALSEQRWLELELEREALEAEE